MSLLPHLTQQREPRLTEELLPVIVFAVGTYAVNSIILGWVAATCGQTREKKAVSLAFVNTWANVSFVSLSTPPLTFLRRHQMLTMLIDLDSCKLPF